MSVKELIEKLGIKQTTIKSGELKDAGSPFRDVNQKDIEYFQEIINDSYDQFLEVVSKERKISLETLKPIANGRVFTGKQAKNLKLIDSLGTFEDAVKIAASIAGINGEPTLVKEKLHRGFLELFFESLSNSGINKLKNELEESYLKLPILQYKFEK
jgi:protease-4